MCLEAEPYEASPEEQKTFNASHDGLTNGWRGTMEQLTTYLATLTK
jgi:hypothetical protein